jgi:hypothetical protein
MGSMPTKRKKRESWKEKQRKRQVKQQRSQEAYQIRKERETVKKPRKWLKWKILGAFCLAIMIFGVYGYWQYYISQLPPSIGGAASTSASTGLASAFSIRDINGTQFTLNQDSEKVIIVHFMAVGCSGQIYDINKHQLRQLKSLCNTYCVGHPFVIVTVAVATCPNSQLASIRSSYGVTWILGNDYDDQILDIVNTYTAYSIRDGSVILVDKSFHVAQVYTEQIAPDIVASKINQLLEV